MLNHFKFGLGLCALAFSLSSSAETLCTEGSDLKVCGIAFSSIGTIPALSTLNCSTPVSVNYTIINQGNTGTGITLSLTENDSLSDPTAIVLDGSTTCPNPGSLGSTDSCNIVLDFQPCVAGNLNWSLTVTPTSTQRPLVLPLTATVASDPAIAYIVNSGTCTPGGYGSISICEVNSADGTFDACTNPPAPTYGVTLNGPASIVLNHNRTFAYITNFGNYDGSTVTICPVNSDYTLGSESTPCYNTTGPDIDNNPTFNQPNGIALSHDNNTLYVANGGNGSGSTGNSIVACPVNSDGSLGACLPTAAGAGPNGVYSAIAANGTPLVYAVDYFTSGNSGNGIVSLFNATDPIHLVAYSPATDTAGGSLNGPVSMVLNPSKTIGYIVNQDDNPGTVTYCPMNTDGTFKDASCQNTVTENLLEYPAGLWISASQIYISNNAGNVTFCDISSVDGSLSGCQNLSDPTFDVPNDVFIAHFP